MSLELIFLGTGTSAGIPMIACDCNVCTSADPRDNRTRPSVLIQYQSDDPNAPDTAQRQFIVDTSPELRQQCIREKLTRIDGVFITHNHADHILGLDDLRRFNASMDAPINLYAEASVLERLHQMFLYIFEPHRNVNKNSFVASLIPQPIDIGKPLDFFGATFTPLRLMHGRLPIFGLRIDYQNRSLAYCTDVSTIPPETYPYLQNLDILVIDALRFRHHPTHLTVDQALDIVHNVQPKEAYFTHMTHDIKHADLEPELPENVHLAYDGLKLSLPAHTKQNGLTID
ncbi:MBL fold metallo-hydrolase [Poriferisphaera sp. WC338]|uniref:MBL fold metallo-hydrolase n=1 Tax=Poriferisphaera sp. WC338 TaxID=3425129 RepID=UPI003D81B2B0